MVETSCFDFAGFKEEMFSALSAVFWFRLAFVFFVVVRYLFCFGEFN